MDRTERFYKIDQLMHERRAVPLSVMMDELDVSKATIKRDLEYLRDRMNAPIIWDNQLRGYRYDGPSDASKRFELPGMWFNASEAHALLTMEYLLENLQPGLLGPHIEPLRTRIRMLLDTGDHSAEEVKRRIRVLHMAARPIIPENFEVIATAVLKRCRLQIGHYNRGRDEVSQREVSPQRLVYYRDNWYLDTWCHLRNALRSFSVDAIHDATQLNKKARNVAEKRLDAELGSGYGIFSGQKTQQVTLRFSPKMARWVSKEEWHPDQKGRYDQDGYYLLTFPYANDTELLMDILRYGADVEVIKPVTLRTKVQAQLKDALKKYPD